MSSSPYTFRLATLADKPAIVQFMNTHWGSAHPLVNIDAFFNYYYVAPSGGLQFALAFSQQKLAALAGFVLANQTSQPDVWVSIWVADPAERGSGLDLMAKLPELTGCRTLACNNIRPNTRPFYEFLGYTTGQVNHYYRLANKASYVLARVHTKTIAPTHGQAELQLLSCADELHACGFAPPKNTNPYKDLWYITRRYFAYPHQSYQVYGVFAPRQKTPDALLVARLVPACGTCTLRIVDFIGAPELLAETGTAIDRLMAEQDAEYADLYCAGLADSLLWEAGFARRKEEDGNIIPNYLNPPLFENTDYYYFTNRPQGFVLFKADGDQDRPNISPTTSQAT